MTRILIIGKPSTISAQLAAIAPLWPNARNINSNGGETSRHQIVIASPQAAGIPHPAANQGERT